MHPFVFAGRRMANDFPWIFEEVPGLDREDLAIGGHAVVGPVALRLFEIMIGRASTQRAAEWDHLLHFMEKEALEADPDLLNEICTGFVENLLPETVEQDRLILPRLPPKLAAAYRAMRDWRPATESL